MQYYRRTRRHQPRSYGAMTLFGMLPVIGNIPQVVEYVYTAADEAKHHKRHQAWPHPVELQKGMTEKEGQEQEKVLHPLRGTQ